MPENQRVEDFLKREIKVGTKVIIYGGDRGDVGEVTKVTEWDVDYDDNIQRGRLYPPKLTVKFADEEIVVTTYDITPTTWADYPDGPETLIFETDELEVSE